MDKDKITNIIIPFIVILTFVFLGLFICFIPVDIYYYEYKDLDNVNGIAKECSYKIEEYKKGGQGSPVCILEDGTVKQVKEYKEIYKETVTPIKELLGD